jgi:hypothetical protein
MLIVHKKLGSRDRPIVFVGLGGVELPIALEEGQPIEGEFPDDLLWYFYRFLPDDV